MLSVVIPVCDDYQRLAYCLLGLKRQTYQDFETLIVNEGGNFQQLLPALADCEQKLGRTLHILDTPGSEPDVFRAGHARNVGLQHARSRRVLFLDADCIPNPNVLEAHARYDDQPVAVFGIRRRLSQHLVERLLPADLKTIDRIPFVDDHRFQRGWPRVSRFDFKDVGCAETCQASFPTAKLRELGGFWEEIEGWGGEDMELAWRVMAAGLRLAARTDLIVYHLDHPKRPGANLHKRTKDERVQKILLASQTLPGLVRNGGPIPSPSDSC